MSEDDDEPKIHTSATEGKYGEECAAMVTMLGAEAALLIVKGGAKGDGFSVAINSAKAYPPRVLSGIPGVLRSVADSIEAELRGRRERN